MISKSYRYSTAQHLGCRYKADIAILLLCTNPIGIASREMDCCTLLTFIASKMESHWRSTPLGELRKNMPIWKRMEHKGIFTIHLQYPRWSPPLIMEGALGTTWSTSYKEPHASPISSRQSGVNSDDNILMLRDEPKY